MQKILHTLLACAALLWCATANAQFSATIEQECTDDYSVTYTSFSLTEIAGYLSTDTTALVAALDAFWDADDYTTADITFQLIYNGGETVYPNDDYAYTQGYNGCFWMTEDGAATDWGDNSAFYNLLYWDANEDAFYIGLGQYPDYYADGGSSYANFLLSYNGSSVVFEVTLEVTAAEVPEITIDNVYANLTIVGSTTISATQYPRSSYTSDYCEATISGLGDLLGTTASSLASYLSYYVYVRGYDYDTYTWSDTLNNTSTATEPGFWFSQTYDEETDSDLDECYSATYASNSIFFAEYFDYDADTETLSCYIGQYPGNCEENATYYAYVYIINGSLAYQVKIELNLIESVPISVSSLTLAGSEWHQVKQKSGSASDATIDIDLDNIASVLGLDSSDDISLYYAFADSLSLTDDGDGYGGFWFGTDGYVANYSDADAAMYIDPYSTSELTPLYVGQYYKTAIEAGDSLTCSLIVLNADTTQYYEIQVNLRIREEVETEVEQADWTIVYTYEEDLQLIPDDENYDLQTSTLDLDEICAALELDDGVDEDALYTWSESYDGTSWLPENLTNSYTCTPYPGFWMSEDGTYNYGWSYVCAYGMSFDVSTGEIQWYNYPGYTEVGETYTAWFYIVNIENGYVAEIKYNIEFVEEIVEITDAGEEDITILLDDSQVNDDGMYYASNDLSTMYETLGMTADEYDTGIWYVTTAAGRTGQPTEWEIEITNFDADGYYTTDDSEALFSVVYDDIEGQFVASIFGESTDNDILYTTTLYYRYDYSRYAFNITLTTSEDLVGISALSATQDTANTGLYDLSGRRLTANTKTLAPGLYIVNGKKVLVK